MAAVARTRRSPSSRRRRAGTRRPASRSPGRPGRRCSGPIPRRRSSRSWCPSRRRRPPGRGRSPRWRPARRRRSRGRRWRRRRRTATGCATRCSRSPAVLHRPTRRGCPGGSCRRRRRRASGRCGAASTAAWSASGRCAADRRPSRRRRSRRRAGRPARTGCRRRCGWRRAGRWPAPRRRVDVSTPSADVAYSSMRESPSLFGVADVEVAAVGREGQVEQALLAPRRRPIGHVQHLARRAAVGIHGEDPAGLLGHVEAPRRGRRWRSAGRSCPISVSRTATFAEVGRRRRGGRRGRRAAGRCGRGGVGVGRRRGGGAVVLAAAGGDVSDPAVPSELSELEHAASRRSATTAAGRARAMPQPAPRRGAASVRSLRGRPG